MSLGSQDGANTGQTDQLYYVPVSAQYPSSTYDSTYPTSNLGTQGPTSYILLPGLRTGYATATNATSESGYRNPSYSAPGSNSNVVYLTSPNSQSIPQVVAAYPNTTPSANGSSYNTPQSSQGSVPYASVSNSGVAPRWDGQSYQKTTVTTGSSCIKVETYSNWSVGPSFVQYPDSSGTIQQPNATVYTGHPTSNGNSTMAYYSKSGNGFQPN